MFDSLASNEPHLPAVQGSFGRLALMHPFFFSLQKNDHLELFFSEFCWAKSSDLPLISYLIPHVVLEHSACSLVNIQSCFTILMQQEWWARPYKLQASCYIEYIDRSCAIHCCPVCELNADDNYRGAQS
jgi:hypothetical protein